MTIENNGISTANYSKFSAPRPEGVAPSCVVVTYSVSKELDIAIETLQKNGTSVHYIIDQNGKQYQYHNDLTDKAFYAGNSSWKGIESVNNFGIGIMFINDSESSFTNEQLTQAKKLLEDIKDRYPNLDIENNLVGLGEVAEKHIAPGKFFPWKELAEAGFGKFVSTTKEDRENILLKKGDQDDESHKVSPVQLKLQTYGYGIKDTGTCDDSTVTWFSKFNTRYVPEQSPPENWTQASQNVLDELVVIGSIEAMLYDTHIG